jgi:DNA-binding PadR family transcriptional regulator
MSDLNHQLDVLQGTLDMLILKAVSLGPLHGYGILLRIQQISKDRLEIPQGSLYPALYRLEHRDGLAANGASQRTNAKPSTTVSPRLENANSRAKRRSGIALRM